MTTIIFLKAHVAGYTRADGTAVRPHEDRRSKKPSKLFGSVAGLAKRAYDSLGHDAKSAVDAWNVNWSTGKLEDAFQADNKLAREIEAAFKPVRDRLRAIYGDTIPMYRGEEDDGTQSSAFRQLFSWTPLHSLAQNFASNSLRGIPKPISDDDIKRTVEKYNRTGFASFGRQKFLRNREQPEYYNIYEGHHNEMITDGDDLEGHLRNDQRWRQENIDELKAHGDVYHADVPIDDLVWIPVGGNLRQPEIIARYNPRKQPSTMMAKAIVFLRRRQ